MDSRKFIYRNFPSGDQLTPGGPTRSTSLPLTHVLELVRPWMSSRGGQLLRRCSNSNCPPSSMDTLFVRLVSVMFSGAEEVCRRKPGDLLSYVRADSG